MAEGLLIGQVAELAGVTVKAVRHYEKLGLLPPPDRGTNGYRRYPVAAVLRVSTISRLRRLGLPLSRIGAIEQDTRDGANSTRRELSLLIDVLAEERARLDSRLDALRRLVDALDEGDDLTAAMASETIDALRDALGPEAEHIDARTWAVERRVAGLLQGFGMPRLGSEVSPLLDLIRENPAKFVPLLELDGAIAGLRNADPDDPRVRDAAERLRASRPAFEELIPLLRPPPDDVRSTVQAVVRPHMSAAQRRVFELAAQPDATP